GSMSGCLDHQCWLYQHMDMIMQLYPQEMFISLRAFGLIMSLGLRTMGQLYWRITLYLLIKSQYLLGVRVLSSIENYRMIVYMQRFFQSQRTDRLTNSPILME